MSSYCSIGNTDGVSRSALRSSPSGSEPRAAASRPCTWLSANCMSALGRKSRLSSAEPRTVSVRIRRRPRMPLSASSSGRVTATVICSASNVPPRAITTMRG